MKVAFIVMPESQNAEQLIEIPKGANIDEEIKKYLINPNIIYKYRIADDDETSIIKPIKRRE